MHTVYATLLHLQGEGSSTAPQVFDLARNLAADWLVAAGSRYGLVIQAADLVASEPLERLAGTTSLVSDLSSHEGQRLWRATLQHQDTKSQTLLWRSEIHLRDDVDGAVIFVRIGHRSTGTSIVPPQYHLGRPALVRTLSRKFVATFGGLRMLHRHVRVSREEVPALVSLLTLDTRGVPVVVVSRNEDEALCFNPVGLADSLAGLAVVVELESFDAAYSLTGALGKQLSVYNGALRVYWPGLSASDNPWHHPLWLPNTLRTQGDDLSFAKVLLSRIAAVAAGRVEPDSLMFGIERAVATEVERRAALRLEAQGAPDEVVPAAWLADFEATLELSERRHRQVDELREQVQELQAQLATERENHAYALSWSQRNEDHPAVGEERVAKVESMLDAVLLVKQCCASDWFVVLPDALESAEESGYLQPTKVYEALVLLAAVALLFRTHALNGSFTQIFQRFGVPFAPDISKTARGKYAADYQFSWRGKKIPAGPHFKFGKGSPDTCARVYWHCDDESRTLVVCHVGKHLPDDSS